MFSSECSAFSATFPADNSNWLNPGSAPSPWKSSELGALWGDCLDVWSLAEMTSL